MLTRKRKTLLGNLFFWGIVLLVSTYYYLINVESYIFYNPSEVSEVKLKYKWWLVAHFVPAATTLFLGPLQFIPYIRNRFLKFHRISGKIYIIGSLISALTVYVLLVTTYSLPGAIPSLALLATIWIFTTIMAYVSIRKRNVKVHKEFMIRSYICGLAFVFIRLLPEVDYFTGIFSFIEDDTMRYTVYEWICWVYPLMITEFFLSWRPQLKKLLKTSRK
ncbi:DUF2306 domain-containing protein [Flagellimonas marina]|uniref:DUF2306 domain-containing protein n=1 Tax=Flagellimonas marina TaxID=1775168 RepID=A0ABV8PK65_9FLAO